MQKTSFLHLQVLFFFKEKFLITMMATFLFLGSAAFSSDQRLLKNHSALECNQACQLANYRV